MNERMEIVNAIDEIDMLVPRLAFLSQAFDALAVASEKQVEPDFTSLEWQGISGILMEIETRLASLGKNLAEMSRG